MTDFVSVQHFEVFHLWCEQMRPEAKHKFVVIVGIEPDYVFGFVINSRLNQFTLEQAHLLPCHALLLETEHSDLLTHDSFVNCQTPYTFPRSSLTEDTRRIVLSMNAQQAILEAVKLCSVLKPKHKNRILNQS
jgi:hypothetical protein